GSVGALLEGADVTEGAAVDTAHIGVQRPLERHAAHAVERHLARLLAILDPHVATIEHMFDGLARLTMPLPMRPNHVHCYLLEGQDGWTLVDTGLSLPQSDEVFAEVAQQLKIARIVITHFHPDHVGGAQQARAATGATVHQGALDYEQCAHVWGNDDWV